MRSQLTFDAELLRRYDRHGPRYTSYPTAAQFHTGFDVQTYRRAALLSNTNPSQPLSAYVHIPFCASPCFYCGCNKIITRDFRQGEQYLTRLMQEITLQSPLFDASRRLRQLHLGGGTPTFLSVEQLERLIEHLDHHFRLDLTANHEYSIEIDPRVVDEQTLPSLKVLGFNRLSLGVQDFDPKVQAAVNRVQSVETILDVVAQARSYGFDSVNFDLIYGLPLQTIDSFAQTLEQVVRMRPDRIAAYGYAHLPSLFKAQHAIRDSDLPTPETRLKLLQLTVAVLTAAGYVYIGMDHFALPEDELARARNTGHLHRSFQGYSTSADCDLIGLGVSAIGQLDNAYTQNAKHLVDYYRAIDSGKLPIERGVTLSVDDRLRREIIQQIMCGNRVDFTEIETRYALEFRRYFARELVALEGMAQDDLLSVSDQGLSINPSGQLLLRNIAMVFDAYLQPASTARFSKTI